MENAIDEIKLTRSEIAKRMWARPEFRAKRVGFHFSPESIEKMRIAHKGHCNITEEGRKKLSNLKKGVKRPPHVAENLKTINKGRYPSEETRKKLSACHKGKRLGSDNPMWKGGITPLATRIRASFEYRQWRSDIFTRDNFTCMICGERGGYLEAHHEHKKFVDILRDNRIEHMGDAKYCEVLWDINNGVTMCNKCHGYTKKGGNVIRKRKKKC